MENYKKFSNTKIFKTLIFSFFYFSILIGFYFDENSTIGPKIDFTNHLKTLEAFETNLKYALLNFHNNDYPTRISPIFLVYLHYLKILIPNIDLLRFFSLNIYIISPFIFYNCLKLKFKSIDKIKLFIFSFLLYLSPSFRANTIWPESSMLAIIFFLFSIYFYLRFQENKKFYFVLLNIFFLSIAAYIRPTYSLFALFFFINFYREFSFSYKILIVIFFNLILSLPAFYYIFILKVYFIHGHGLSFNLSDKIFIISTIIFFYFLPFLLQIYNSNKINLLSKNLFYPFLVILLIYFILIPEFSYDLKSAGGGIFLHLSHFIFKSEIFFFIICFFSILVIYYISLINLKNNIPLILILFLLSPQTHIFHKYYDPLLIICIVLLFNFSIKEIFKIKNLTVIYLYFFSFYLINLINSLMIKY
tara:strand:- start:312 stop:1565 length:1254 start_codon:yes stop_codon:yes gene_type:complete